MGSAPLAERGVILATVRRGKCLWQQRLQRISPGRRAVPFTYNSAGRVFSNRYLGDVTHRSRPMVYWLRHNNTSMRAHRNQYTVDRKLAYCRTPANIDVRRLRGTVRDDDNDDAAATLYSQCAGSAAVFA
ncbi:hypothetical protein CBL_01443 [Carabus blaptoides fortunei]